MTAPGEPPTAIREAYCLSCGRVAHKVVGPSMTPDVPLILCRWWNDKHELRGCGRTLGLYDAERTATIVDDRKRRAATRQHPNHPGRERHSNLCAHCLAATPKVRARA